MASVAILNPQDCLKQSFPSKGILRTPSKFNNPNPNNNRRRKRTSSANNRVGSPPPSTAVDRSSNNNKPVMGQVKILKRGEDIKLLVEEKAEMVAEKIMAVDEVVDRKTEVEKAVEKKTEPSKFVVMENKVEGLGSVDRIGPDPMLVSKQIRLPVNGFYAGSAFVTSPPPSSVPMPGFCNKKAEVVQNDVASSDLKRILGLAMA